MLSFRAFYQPHSTKPYWGIEILCLSQPRPLFTCETKAFMHISGLSLHTCPRLCRIVDNYGCGLVPECTLYTDGYLRHDTQLHHQTTHHDSKYSCAVFLDINHSSCACGAQCMHYAS